MANYKNVGGVMQECHQPEEKNQDLPHQEDYMGLIWDRGMDDMH
jgi:hypothetical protein